MHAVTLSGFGGPEVMAWTEVADVPAPGPGEITIEVAAAGVNRADVMQRAGFYPPPPGTGDILGLEVSGVVAAVGTDVDEFSAGDFAVGDRVCALLAGGGYAERVNVPATQVLPVPRGVDLIAAAALPEAAATVWSNVVMTAGLRGGQRLLIHGGGSGIGTHAIQIGRALGAEVAVTAGTGYKLERCAELGATTLIDYHEQNFADVIGELGGANVILDIIGAGYLSRNVAALATGGQLTIIGLQGGATAELDLGATLFKRASIHVTNLRRRPRTGAGSKAEIVAEVRRRVWPLIEGGSVRPVVAATLPITDVARAHTELDSPRSVGKVLLTVPSIVTVPPIVTVAPTDTVPPADGRNH
ncbi:NAD(P)H-quinone oxidoreductase [Skermania piniformis]|uniref:NAD(P)H-quinone oxidoreductase n=1 Tax=Skermania pinensis TaxID=39122 RepID=A0ABX8S7K7_9ACTN|nr:NAD(P)H-quinone oxidoreductase [Skermania piniformis]QXQ13251.1 NAD(P)H-quinone oxidoreductase [Skermania piniformis]